MGNNLRIRAAAIAVTMVAIMMRINDLIDLLGGRCGIGIGGQHVLRQRHIEQRIDDKGLVIIDNQTGIGPAPAAIGLQPRISAITDLM